MAVNKVVYSGQTLMDISDSTVTSENLTDGIVAYNAAGERIVGSMVTNDPLLQPSHTVIDNITGNVTQTLSDRTITTIFSKSGSDDVITETHVMNTGDYNFIKKTTIKKIGTTDDITITVDSVSK